MFSAIKLLILWTLQGVCCVIQCVHCFEKLTCWQVGLIFRIAKLLRQSFRRSMRRLAGALGDNGILPPPPDYSAVLVEMNGTPQGHSELPEPSSAQPGARISTMTAADVAHILRSSTGHRAQQNRHTECLVEQDGPVHHDVAVHPSGTEFNFKPEAKSTSLTWNAYSRQ